MDKTNVRVLKQFIATLSLLLLVSQAHAFGLGKLRVNSALDEPLDAEIEVTAVTPEDRESLAVSLGSRPDFRRAGVERPEYLNDLNFAVVEREPGTVVIKITSKQPAKEPFLHFLVAVEWSGGKLIREYTALLDPPVYAAETPTAVSSPQVVEGMAPETQPMPEDAGPAPGEGPVGEEDMVRFGEYGPTKAGDTLWGIASKLQVETPTVNVFQIMIALLRENPEAFFDNNVNRLKAGQILRVNDLAAIADISPQEAAVAYQAQLEEWQAYKQQIAAAPEVAKMPAGVAMEGAEPSTAPPEAEEPMTTAEADKEILRIVQATDQPTAATEAGAPAPSAEAQAEIERLTNQISTLEESLASKELEAQELRERVTLLEEQVKNATRLMEIESQELALAQKQAAEREQAIAEQAKAEQAKAEQAKATAAPAEPKAEVPPAAAKAKAEPPAVTQPKPRPRVTAPPSPSWWQNILEPLSSYWTFLAAAVAVLIAGTGGLLFVRRRRSLAEFEESILSGQALEAQTETTTTQQTTAATTDTSFLSDFGMTGVGSVEADEVDPLAEAEVYLAYGRDEQAEEVLKEAVQRHADRPELKLKLLEIYQQREDLKSFETLAEELYPAGGQGDPNVWQKVVAMGRKMNPDNPLFSQEMPAAALDAGGGTIVEAEAEGGAELATEFDSTAVPVDPGLQPFPAPDEDVALDEELEKLANDAEDTAKTIAPDDVFEDAKLADTAELDNLDFDLDIEEEAATAHADSVTQINAVGAGDDKPGDDNLLSLDELEIDLESTTDSDTKRVDEAATALAAEGMPGMDFETAASETPATESPPMGSDDSEHWDEAATKLDLAKAYIDMGDKAGARSIIDEVMREGNQEQRDQAAQLANQLGS